jgi:hypothetical protein
MKLLVVDNSKDITDAIMLYSDSRGLDCTALNNGWFNLVLQSLIKCLHSHNGIVL